MAERATYETQFTHLAKSPANQFRDIFEQTLGVNVDQQTLNHIGVAIEATRLADAFIDREPDPKQRVATEVAMIDFIGGQTDTYSSGEEQVDRKLAELRAVALSLPQERHSALIVNLTKTCEISERIKQTTSPRKFATLRRVEGDYYAKFFLSLVPENMRNYKFKKLDRVFRRIARVSNAVDAVLDMNHDYSTGQIKLKPSFRSRAYLTASVMGDATTALRGLHPKFYLDMARNAMTTVRTRKENI